MMASRIQRRSNLDQQGRVRPIHHLGHAAVRDLWVEYAQAIRDSDGSTFTPVLYDRWFTERSYRDEVAESLGFTNRDSGVDYVPGHGEGSSFDGTAFQGHAHEMGTLDRWRMFNEDGAGRDLYAPLVTPAVVALNQELFGSNPSIV